MQRVGIARVFGLGQRLPAVTTAWPLSAPATVLLRQLKTPGGELLRLGVRELVLVRAWRLEAGPPSPPKRFRRAQPGPELHLLPLRGRVPPTLERLDRALRLGSINGGPASAVVTAALRKDTGLAAGVRRDALQELVTAGLLAERPRPLGLGTRRELSPSGTAWQAAVPAAHGAWRADLRAGGPRAGVAASAAAAAPGLLLASDEELLAELDGPVRAARSRAAGSGGDGGSGYVVGEGTTGAFDGLDGIFGDLLDGLRGLGTFDFGISDGGGSGDGGGGGSDSGVGDAGGGGGD